jgi:hypothetical protein
MMKMNRYPEYKGPIEYINNTPYQVVATYPITRVKDAKLIKDWLGCDSAFKSNRDNLFIFCNEIQEVQWEDVKQTTII